MKHTHLIGLVVVVLVLGAAGGYWLGRPSRGSEPAGGDAKAEQIWTCAMHPQIRQSEPGLCPICAMDLTPLEGSSEKALDDDHTVELSEAALQLAQVQTSLVRSAGGTARPHQLIGALEIDPNLQARVPSEFAGRLEVLKVKDMGSRIGKGEVFGYLYAPAWVTMQEELLQAWRLAEAQPDWYASVRSKLRNMNVADADIDALEASGVAQRLLPLRSPRAGTVLDILVREGDWVAKGAPILDIADLSRLWVVLDAYESDLTLLTVGQSMKLSVSGIPSRLFDARIGLIEPVLDAGARIARVRAELMNPSGSLRPGMEVMASVMVGQEGRSASLMVPRSAVLWTGKRSLVYRRLPGSSPPRFQFTSVTLGALSGDMYEVTEGLAEGDEVVSRGAYTVDAAAQLGGKVSMMNPPDTSLRSANFKVRGNCSMCKERIEGAYLVVAGVHRAIWDVDSKMLKVTYARGKISVSELHRLAVAAGHDTEEQKADDERYAGLPACCAYPRESNAEH